MKADKDDNERDWGESPIWWQINVFYNIFMTHMTLFVSAKYIYSWFGPDLFDYNSKVGICEMRKCGLPILNKFFGCLFIFFGSTSSRGCKV